MHFVNSYADLGLQFAVPTLPTPLPDPYLVSFNASAASLLDLDPSPEPDLIAVLAGNRMPPGSRPTAAVYAGHQFGSWVSQLGDGRAISLGDLRNRRGQHWELQLKGAGETPFSRMGDGRAVLRSTIREYLCSEAMHALGIPTSRALAIVGSDEPVYRETIETAAVLSRLSPSFVRFGTFEFFFYRGEHAHLKTLADALIQDHFPELGTNPKPYLALLREVAVRTARTIADWQAVGFQHGVMNTDNMSILGLTLDYGPFGFMESYDPDWICNHSDHLGRYRFSSQPSVAFWNLHCLAAALEPLVSEQDATEALACYEPELRAGYLEQCRKKLGLTEWPQAQRDLLNELFGLMQRSGSDYTLVFRRLSEIANAPDPNDARWLTLFGDPASAQTWLASYRDALSGQPQSQAERQAAMKLVNPKYVLRNYLAQQAIERAQQHDFSEIERLLGLLRSPFEEQPEHEKYGAIPPDWAKELAVSCSS